MHGRVLPIVLGMMLVVMLAAAAPALAAVYTAEQCLDCHTELNPGIVTQFQSGAMADAGVTCVNCHGGDHGAIALHQGKVPASACAQAGCHPDQYAEFAHKDASGGFTNKHAIGWTRMTAAARYAVMPPEQRYEMCERCHNIGYVSDDGSVGKCDSCHTRHTFSSEEAREPAACGTCHMGPDHEQIDMYEKSKHGVTYATERGRAGGDPGRAPTCVTCHMPEGTKAGGNPEGEPLIHDVSTTITIGTVAQGGALPGTAQPVPMRTTSPADLGTNRGRMEAICSRCHSWFFVNRNLEAADEIKRDVDDLLWDPVMRIRGLWYDGLLDPMPQNRLPNPLFGQALVLGGQQLYGGTSAIEQLFFTTYKYDHVSTFKGAYHINPDYSHWYGWSRVMQDRDLIKGEEARLRRIAGSDPGFSIDTDGPPPTVRKPVVFNASRLATWGDPSANTYEWWLGDGASSMASTSPIVAHIYEAPGRYTVQLTCADSDLVNDAAKPVTCSAKRTTSRAITVKYGSSVVLRPIAAVPAGGMVTFRGRLALDAPAQDVLVTLWKRTAGGSWRIAVSRAVTREAGTSSLTFHRTLSRTTSYKITFAGDAGIWKATSGIRTVKPL